MATDEHRTAATAAEVVPVGVPVRVASQVPETLPGLDPDSDLERASYLERSVVATLEAYRQAGLVSPAQAGKVALALSLSRVMVDKERRGRTSTYANDARLLNEILDGFVAEEGAGQEALRAVMEEWSRQVAAWSAGLAAGQAIAAAS